MIWRLLAAIPGTAISSLLIGMAIARHLEGDADSAMNAGTLSTLFAWAVLSAACIAQRRALHAWAIVGGTAMLSAISVMLA